MLTLGTEYAVNGTSPSLKELAYLDVNASKLTFTDNQDLAFLKSGDLLTSNAVTAQTSAFTTTLYNGNGSTNTVNTGIDNLGQWLLSGLSAVIPTA